MTDRQIQLVVARAENGQVRATMTIEGRTETFTIAAHVAASAVSALSRALAELAVDSAS